MQETSHIHDVVMGFRCVASEVQSKIAAVDFLQEHENGEDMRERSMECAHLASG